MSNGIIIQGVDAEDIIKFISSKNKKMQAIFLKQLEDALGPETQEFRAVRKLFLDYSNGYKRAVLSAVFGDVERE